uniref:Xin actin binding repeat containing 2a n=1 Tax=Cyprinus carpio TaxID=7962 RepID=A0A8C2Q1Q8_CYPCA
MQEASTSSVASSQYEVVENSSQPVSGTHQFQMTSQVPERCPSPKPTGAPTSAKYAVNKEQYNKQRNLYELKRLYKHIHPEVRKNLECDFFTEYLEWDEILKGEVQSMRWMFENKPLDSIKDGTPDEDEGKNITQQEIIAGKDVKYTTWVFETQPMDALGTEKTDSAEQSGKLDLARGDVQTATWLFETQPLDSLNRIYQEDEQETQVMYTKDIAGGDVKTARYLFETQHLDTLGHTETIDESHFLQLKSELEEVKGEVKKTTKMFETQPMCVIRGDSGEMLEITKVRREETEKGDVRTSRWLFETQPLDLINNDPSKVKLICGVSMEENYQGEVNRGRWLFETKTLDQIKDEEWESTKIQKEEILGADVRRHCKTFETQPMDKLKDNTNARPMEPEDIIGGDVTSARHLFETVPMENLKELPEVGKLQKVLASEEEKGDVRHQRWLFESKPLEQIREEKKEITRTINLEDLEKGDVTNYKEIFETMDLSKCTDAQKIQVEGVTSGSVKSNKVLFESTPLYAVQDSSGHYHEVKTVRREEVVKGNARSYEVYVIKAVTEEDIQKGDVSTARWRFETQPLDEIAEDMKVAVKTVADIQGGDVKTNKQHFEMDDLSKKYVKTVSVSEIQRGNVRSSTWMFETRTIDKIRGEGSDYDEMEKVTREEVVKGDVKQSVWLFEKESLDRIKEVDETDTVISREEIPKADVKTTTWLFETTPLTDFNESSVERKEIVGKSIKATLEELYTQKMVESQGILIEADEIGDVRMAKYKLLNQDTPEIQKEEVIHGDLDNIMMNLLNRCETTERAITIDREERGNINSTVQQLFNQNKSDNVEKEHIIRGDIQEAINNLLKQEGSSKRGILIQEDEKGDVKMTIYSLLNEKSESSVEKEDIVRGNIRGTVHRLLGSADAKDLSSKITVGEGERGNVSFYSTCIESGAMDYLRQLRMGTDETVEEKVKEKIIGGDVEQTKQILRKSQQTIGRTVTEDDIVPGDVNNTVQVFMMEPVLSLHNMQKVEIVKGDLRAALDSLTQAVNQSVVIEKEEIVKGDICTTLRSLEEAQNQLKEIEKPEIVPGDIKGALESLEKSSSAKPEVIIEDVVPGDIRGTLKSLEEAKQVVKEEIKTATQVQTTVTTEQTTITQKQNIKNLKSEKN